MNSILTYTSNGIGSSYSESRASSFLESIWFYPNGAIRFVEFDHSFRSKLSCGSGEAIQGCRSVCGKKSFTVGLRITKNNRWVQGGTATQFLKKKVRQIYFQLISKIAIFSI